MSGRWCSAGLTILLWLLFVPAPSVCPANDGSLERIGSHGVVDWIGQRVSASGVGVPRQGAGPAQARVLAERAALTVARRNLLEVIRGVHIDSRTTVENFMVADDAIVARVAGEVKFARVDRVEHLGDGSVQTTVSMPLTGSLGAIVLQAAAARTPPADPLMRRIQQLEKRVAALEEKVAGLSRTAVDREEVLDFFRRFAAVWSAHTSARLQTVAVGQAELQQLAHRLQEQERRIAEMGDRLDRLAERLITTPAGLEPPAPGGKQKATPYTGLVIDARGTGFRPCLKPEIFGHGEQLYPGASVDLQTAIRGGYVRYYRRIEPAQQSDRVGSLPLTVRAKGTFRGERSLEIEGGAFRQVKAAAAQPDSFIDRCRVVIVF